MAVAKLVPIGEYLSTHARPDVLAALEMPTSRFITKPPYIVVEILSRDDRASEVADKIDDYLDFDVPNIWVVDPRKRRIAVHGRGSARACGDIRD